MFSIVSSAFQKIWKTMAKAAITFMEQNYSETTSGRDKVWGHFEQQNAEQVRKHVRKAFFLIALTTYCRLKYKLKIASN